MTQEEQNNLIRLVKLVGGKFVIVEDGKPTAVVMSFQEFEDLVTPSVTAGLVERMSNLMDNGTEEVNAEVTRAQLQDLREEVIDLDFGQKQESDEITIEPLEI